MKAIGYVRVSTDEQAKEGISLGHQREKIKAYAKLHDMTLLEIIEDQGLSAKNLKGRPGVCTVIDLAKSGAVQAVIVYKLDRMFRNAAEALSVSTEFNAAAVALHSVTESLDTTSAMGKFFFTIMAACAEMERNLISERTRDALRHKKSMGEVYNHIPYGYREVGGRLIEDSNEQRWIHWMKKTRSAGHTYRMIADQLNFGQISTKGYGKGKNFRQGEWHPETVRSVLKNAEERRYAVKF